MPSFVREGVIGMVKSANLRDEVDQVFYSSQNKINNSFAAIAAHTNAKTISRNAD